MQPVNCPQVRGRLLLPASAARVYSILTDYDNCHRVFTNIAASEVVLTEDGGLQVMQVGPRVMDGAHMWYQKTQYVTLAAMQLWTWGGHWPRHASVMVVCI